MTHAVWDEEGEPSPVTFTLDGSFLNKKLRLFRHVDMDCKGFVHSHPRMVTRPSAGDVRYVTQLFGNPKNQETGFVYMPIFCGNRLYPYAVDRHGTIVSTELILV